MHEYLFLYGRLSAFEHLRKATIGFVTFGCTSVCSSALNSLALTENF